MAKLGHPKSMRVLIKSYNLEVSRVYIIIFETSVKSAWTVKKIERPNISQG